MSSHWPVQPSGHDELTVSAVCSLCTLPPPSSGTNTNRTCHHMSVSQPACHQPTLLWVVRLSPMEADGTVSRDIQGLDMGLEGLTSIVPVLSVAFSKNCAANT